MSNTPSIPRTYTTTGTTLPYPAVGSTSTVTLNEDKLTSSNGTTLSNFLHSPSVVGLTLQYVYLVQLPPAKNVAFSKNEIHTLYFQLGNSNVRYTLFTTDINGNIAVNVNQLGQLILTSNTFINTVKLISEDTTSNWNWNNVFFGPIELYIDLKSVTQEFFTDLYDNNMYYLGCELSPTNQGNTNNQNNLGYVNHNNLGPIHSKTLESPTTHRESVNILPSHNVPTIPQYPINTLPYLQNNHILPSNIPTVLTSQHPSLIHPREQKHKHKHESKSSHENESFWQKYGSAIIWIIIIIIVILIIYAIVKSHKKSGKSSFGKCRKFNSNVYY